MRLKNAWIKHNDPLWELFDFCGLEKFSFYHDIRESYKENRFTIYKKHRLAGCTTFSSVLAINEMIEGKNVLYISTAYGAATTVCSITAGLIRKGDLFNFKETDHTIERPGFPGKITFRSPYTATCGQACDLLIIEEAAYIKDMYRHWKAIFPCLMPDGKAIINSTPNRREGWFYTVHEDKRNAFNVVKIPPAHTHPHCPWGKRNINEIKSNLGDIGYRKEFLMEFVD